MKKRKIKFFTFTKGKILFALVFFALLVYLVRIPVRSLMVLEVIIAYLIACMVIFLHNKHRRSRKVK